MISKIEDFTQNLLEWFRIHGRHDLPWQENQTAYRVWVSEIMLQQTQVSAVIGYYQRFMEKFPTIQALAEANPDEVLGCWSGLGYYARARNLHRCAQIVYREYAGKFPEDISQMCELPGIGRSTAGAILSFSMNQRAPILDGNVKRVLTRYHAIGGSPAENKISKQLWELAEQHTPVQNFAEYTQAIMDLGATICTRGKPACTRCPVSSGCEAYRQARTHEFPTPKKTKSVRPKKSVHLLILKSENGGILLEKRPPSGIWGGLWSFPECGIGEDIRAWCARHFDLQVLAEYAWPAFQHIFTHFELAIHPLALTVKSAASAKVMEASGKIWYNPSEPLPGGVPAPVSKLLEKLRGET